MHFSFKLLHHDSILSQKPLKSLKSLPARLSSLPLHLCFLVFLVHVAFVILTEVWDLSH